MSMEILCERILSFLPYIRHLYYRLILIVGPAGSGKTFLLRTLSRKLSIPVINLNLEVSKSLLEIDRKQWFVCFSNIVEKICSAYHREIVLLDNTEVLFEPDLKVDPLRVLRNLSRERTVIASWNGRKEGKYLIYAVPGHPSYRKYFVKSGEFLIESLFKEESL